MAIKKSNVVVGITAIFGALALVACSGAEGTVGDRDPSASDQALKGEVPIDPPRPDSGTTVPACFSDVQGGPTSCKSSATWKEYAALACKAKGTSLARIEYGASCGKDLFRETKYECCAEPPPPPPPPPVCKTEYLGDKTSCKSAATWKHYAFAHCENQKLTLTNLALGESCGIDYARGVKVECCDLNPSPPSRPCRRSRRRRGVRRASRVTRRSAKTLPCGSQKPRRRARTTASRSARCTSRRRAARTPGR